MDNKDCCTYGVAQLVTYTEYLIIMLEPSKSFVRVIQSIGRGIRQVQIKTMYRLLTD